MEAGDNMRRVYKIANTLHGRVGYRTLHEWSDATHSAIATRFQTSFYEKIDALLCKSRHLVDDAASPTDVKGLMLESAAKSCELDQLSSSLLKRHVDALSPILARIINASLSSAVDTVHEARGCNTPILKTRKADLNVLTNWRRQPSGSSRGSFLHVNGCICRPPECL